jgi:hypothetical protein
MKNSILSILSFVIFSPVFSQTGPGGVGNNSSNVVWVKADFGVYSDAGITLAINGAKVRQWNDFSGNGLNGFSNNITNQPVYATNVQNGYPGLRVSGNQFIDFPSLGLNSTTSATYFIAFRDTATGALGGSFDGNGDYIVDRVPITNGLYDLKKLTGNLYAYQKRTDAGPGLNSINTITPINTNIKVIEYRRNYSINYQIFYNNSLENTTTDLDGPTTPFPPKIGRHCTIVNGGMRGYLFEFMIYNFALNSAQSIIVNNYLSAKYDFALSANDLYNEDDVSNGNYDHDVAGIGRIDASNIHNDARGTGTVRILNPTGLDNDEFLIWGHDNGIQQAVETVDVPVGVQARFDRVWRASEVNSAGTAVDVGAIDVRFDLTGLGPVTASDLRLMVDTDNDGVFNDETAIAGATNVSGNIYQFAGIAAIANNLRFTLGTINTNQTPLPIELVYFAAATALDNKAVNLEWQTASEINNDYFTVERSANGNDWFEVVRVDGAGNSSVLSDYSFIDNEPFSGISYYRLKQTDFDGQFSFSQIRSINISGLENSSVIIYPNPTEHQVTVKGNEDELSTVKIYNLIGQDVTYLIGTETINRGLVKIDLTNLSKGVYTIKTKTTANILYK